MAIISSKLQIFPCFELQKRLYRKTIKNVFEAYLSSHSFDHQKIVSAIQLVALAVVDGD